MATKKVEQVVAVEDIQNTAAALLNQNSAEHALVNQLLGQAQMADAFNKFSKTVFTSKLAYVKENKLYRALAGQKNEDGLQLSGTWEEFCRLLNWTPQHANEAIESLKAFGEEALESMSLMGIGYREMRQFRKLPDDSKEALIEVAKSGDKESFVELAEEIISKHLKEKEQLSSERDEAVADYQAQGEVLAKKNQELDNVRFELERTRKRIQSLSIDEANKELRIEVTAAAIDVESGITQKLRAAFDVLHAFGTESEQDQRPFMVSLIKQLEMAILRLRDDYELPNDLEETFDFLNPEAVAATQEAVAALRAERGI